MANEEEFHRGKEAIATKPGQWSMADMPPTESRVPVPDPTTLTTAALLREIASLKEIVFTRLDAMDRAMMVFSDAITRAPTDVDKQIAHLKELHQEKFESIVKQFSERDARMDREA